MAGVIRASFKTSEQKAAKKSNSLEIFQEKYLPLINILLKTLNYYSFSYSQGKAGRNHSS